MSTITMENPIVTLINVFTVAPERQDELIGLLLRATEKVMRHLPGFISANLHKSLDGKHVANYAQWESLDAFEKMLRHPVARSHMQKAEKIATFEPVLYRVDSVTER